MIWLLIANRVYWNDWQREVNCTPQESATNQVGAIVENQMKRWGICTKDGTLNLNWRIVTVPMSVVDSVVVHELVHLGVEDHSQELWQKMRVVLPDHERRKEWLRVHGPMLEF